MQCFAVKRGDSKERLDPRFVLYGGHQVLRGIPLSPLGQLVTREPDYGSGERAIPIKSSNNVKYIRITDFDDDGIVQDNEFATAENIEDRYRLDDGDVLFARSGATAGKTFIFSSEIGPSIFAGYCIRFRFDRAKTLPQFIYLYTKTDRYQAWVRSIQRPSGQPNINKEEFKSFTVPLPPLAVQRQLVRKMERARESRRRKLEQADTLLAGLDDLLLARLGLTLEKKEYRPFYAARLADAWSRSDPDFHSPKFKALRESIERCGQPILPVGKLCLCIKSGFAAGRELQAFDDIQGIPHIRPLNISPHGELGFDGTKYVPKDSVAESEIIQEGEVLEIYYTGRTGGQYLKTAYILCDDYSELVSKLFLLADDDRWTDKKPNNHFKSYHEVLRDVEAVVRAKVPDRLDRLRDLQSAMTNRRARRNDFFHSTSLLDLSVTPRNCVESFCDLLEYGELLLGTDWRQALEGCRNFATLEVMLQLEKLAFSDPSITSKVSNILQNWPRNIRNNKKRGVHVAEYPEDLHLRLCVTCGGKPLRDKLKALMPS